MKSSPNLSLTDTLLLLDQARNAEFCRDIESLQLILQSFWTDTTAVPSFSEYQPSVRAELLRLCGFYLTFAGRSKNIKDYQMLAKDALTAAVVIFEAEKLNDKAAESKIILAFCYWNTGEFSDSDALLDLVENDFGENPTHPVYLQCQINRLMILTRGKCQKKYDAGIEIIKKISGPLELCPDLRLKAMFHSEAGLIFRRKKIFDEALFHHHEAIRFSEKTGNLRFVGINLNNLSMFYKELEKFPEAREYSNKALEIYSALNDVGCIAQILDTKAEIYLEQREFNVALHTINKALEYFYQGEDYNYLPEALWTKTRCLLRLNRRVEAYTTFFELLAIAQKQNGEEGAQVFIQMLADETYAFRHLPLAEEVAAFRKSRVAAALLKAAGMITKAARILGFERHQTLSNILKFQYPALMRELGFKTRAARNSKKKIEEDRFVTLRPDQIHEERVDPAAAPRIISQLVLPTNKQLAFNFHFRHRQFETFYFDKFLMEKFGYDFGAVVVVSSVDELKNGMWLLLEADDGFVVGHLEYTEWADVLFLKDEDGEPAPFDESAVIGAIVAYCPIEQARGAMIEFSRFALKS